MTGSEFLAYVKQVLSRTDKDTEIYTATSDTIMDMRSLIKTDEHMAVSSALSGISAVGDYTLSLPNDFGHLIGDVLIQDTSSDTTYFPLNKMTKVEYDVKYNRNLASSASNRHTGVPVDYAYFGQQIYIGPAVDSTNYQFKINYTTEDTPTITSATTTVPFTDKYREVVRSGVLSRIFAELENYEESNFWDFRYQRGLKKLMDTDYDNVETSSSFNKYNGI